MGLPIFQSDSQPLSLMQTSWAQKLNPLVDQPMSRGFILSGVVLSVGTNQISHQLGRELQGWMIVRLRGAASIYDTQDTNNLSHLTLTLVSSAGVIVDIFVF